MYEKYRYKNVLQKLKKFVRKCKGVYQKWIMCMGKGRHMKIQIFNNVINFKYIYEKYGKR